MTQAPKVSGNWPTWASGTAPRIAQHQEDLVKEFLAWMKNNAPQILEGTQGATIGSTEHEVLRDKLQQGCPVENDSDERALLGWWDRLVEAGNRAKRWKIPLARSLVKVQSPVPAFVRRDFQILFYFRELEWALYESLTGGVESSDLHLCVVMSAITFGGVTSPSMLCAIASLDPNTVRQFEGELRVGLKVPLYEKVFAEETWYPDALTSVLIVRWILSLKVPIEPIQITEQRQLFRLVEKGLKKLNNKALNPKDFLRAARVAHSLEVPPYCAAYLAGDIESHSVPQHVLQRLCGWEVFPTPLDRQSVSQEVVQHKHLKFKNDFDPLHLPVDQLEFVTKVGRILQSGPDSIEKMQVEIKLHARALWPLTDLLCRWILWRKGTSLVEGEDLSNLKAVANSTARRYFGAIARHLIIIGGQDDPMEMEIDDLETLYELGAGRIKQEKEKAVYWMCIKSFHSFLSLYGAPDIVFEELDGFQSRHRGVVIANLVGEREFDYFKTELKRAIEKNPKSHARAVFIAAILGYRCGLRRREVQMLELKNVHRGDHPHLLVRASRLATLKSHSAQRRIPIGQLLMPDELELLDDYCAQLVDARGEYSGLIFSNPEFPDVPLADSVLFGPITEAFQAILGDHLPVFRFHHLRHSFATWLFLALVVADNPSLKSSSPILGNAAFLVDRMEDIHQSLFPRLPGTERSPTRKLLYLVGYLCGHLSPVTTAAYYLHLIDWLAGREGDLALARRLGVMKHPELAKICGISTAALYKPTYQPSLESPVTLFRTFVAKNLPKLKAERMLSAQDRPNLDPVFEKIAIKPLPGPSVMMVILHHAVCMENSVRALVGDQERKRLRESTLARMEANHFVPRHTVELLWQNYCRLIAKQSLRKPSAEFKLPSPPRATQDAVEFWRIVDATVASYSHEKRREDMVAAAQLLVQRIGPSKGHVYFGKHPEIAPKIVNALLWMGLDPSCLDLEVRTTSKSNGSDVHITSIVSEVARQKVEVKHVPLDWEERQAAGELLRLKINNKVSARSNETLKRLTGRIRGINYSALWILFANEMTKAAVRST